MDFAASSVLRSASTVLMSGLGWPARTTMPMNDSASGTRLPARVSSRASRMSAPCPSMITTSACSPRARRVGIASGESPSDGPRVVTSVWPLDFSKAGPSSLYTLKNPAEIMTLISEADAALAASVAIRTASRRGTDRMVRLPAGEQYRTGDGARPARAAHAKLVRRISGGCTDADHLRTRDHVVDRHPDNRAVGGPDVRRHSG